MDRNSTIGMILIFILLVVWMMWNSPTPPQHKESPSQTQATPDTVVKAAPPQPRVQEKIAEPKKETNYGKFFANRSTGVEKIITIETNEIRAEVTSRGGKIRRWQLKRYSMWDGDPVQLVNYNSSGDFNVLFTTKDGKVINTSDLYFDTDVVNPHIVVNDNFEFEISFRLPASNGGMLIKTMKFKNGAYGCDVTISFVHMDDVIANYQYEVTWDNGIWYCEQNSVDEASFGAAFAYAGDELTEVDAAKPGVKVQKEMGGNVDWVAIRNKYFAVAIIPISSQTDGAYLEGIRTPMPNQGVFETYSVSVKMPFKGQSQEETTFKLFAGPLDHGVLAAYEKNLQQLMRLGWAWLIRPISEYIMLPLFKFIHTIIPNWGLVIVVFSLIIKIALHPLSKSSMESMKKMQKLQPMMKEIQEKYKDDPQRMNQAVLNLYKEYGVNPAGGCLPLLIQLPIMYALYAVFRGAIELRQAKFVWWIKDLSVPDVIARLPFRIPLIGIQDISGIALLMGVSMFIQQKMTITDPRQKSMVWLMPILMTILFNGFPSGLNLYYAVFNILAIIQQLFVNKKHDDQPLRKVEPKKKKSKGILRNVPTLPKYK